MSPELVLGLAGVFVATGIVVAWTTSAWLTSRSPEQLRLRQALAGIGDDTVDRRLSCLTVDDGRSVVLGHEPVYLDGRPAGYVTSAAFGHTVGRPIAYAWLPASATVGSPVEIGWFGDRIAATVAAEPLVDPEMARIRG